MSTDSGGIHFGAKLFMALLISLVLGLAWACVETGRSPMSLLGSTRNSVEPPTPADPSKAAANSHSNKSGLPSERPGPTGRRTPDSPPGTPAAPVPVSPPKPVLRLYSAQHMDSLFDSLDDMMAHGKFLEAEEKVLRTELPLVPADHKSKFDDYGERVQLYNDLMQETSRHGVIDMPELTRIFVKNGGGLVVNVNHQDQTAVYYETITGIRSSIEKTRIESMDKLRPAFARAAVIEELRKQARLKGLEVRQSAPGKPLQYRERPGRTVTALQFFDLADFCARNGANDNLAILFDEAYKRDPDVRGAVHDKKADRMINVFLYFLTINSVADAGNALDILQQNYSDTHAFRKRVSEDTEVREAISLVLQREMGPLADANPPPAARNPREEAPPLRRKGPDSIPKPPAPFRPSPPPRPPAAKKSLDDAPAEVQALVKKGDAHFKRAMDLLRKVKDSPSGLAAGFEKAGPIFKRAWTLFGQAQDLYVNGAVPKVILDRFRQAQSKAAMCRKFGYSKR